MDWFLHNSNTVLRKGLNKSFARIATFKKTPLISTLSPAHRSLWGRECFNVTYMSVLFLQKTLYLNSKRNVAIVKRRHISCLVLSCV